MNRLGLTAAIGIAGAAAVAVWAGGKEDSPPVLAVLGVHRGIVLLPPGPDSDRRRARDADSGGQTQPVHAGRRRYLTKASAPSTSTASTKRKSRPQAIIIPTDIGPFIIVPFIIVPFIMSIVPTSFI